MKKYTYVPIMAIIIMMSIVCLADEGFSDTQVTIYNNDLGLIRQNCDVSLIKGISEFQIEGVSSKILTTSVKISFPKLKNKVEVLEQNYLYDLLSSEKLFNKYVGKSITYRMENGDKIKGILLSYAHDKIIVQLENSEIKISSVDKILEYDFPALPEGLILKPTLQWLINSKYKGSTKADLSYLTNGIKWNAEYVLVLKENDSDFSLSSWISLDNSSGASYENARLKLIAGDIHQARPQRFMAYEEPKRPLEMATQKSGVEERAFFDYYLYELQRPVTIKNNEIKQVTLFDEIDAKGRKIYTFNCRSNSDQEKQLDIIFKIENTKANNMGIAIPKGKMRVFKEDIDGSLQLVGEDWVNHTSKNDTLDIKIGQAFDIKGKQIVINREKTSKRSETLTIRITVYNRKDSDIYAEINEHLPGIWEMKKSSHTYQKKSQSLLMFPLDVKANSQSTIEYTYLHKW
ncbi:MAG: hypothetical protein L6422_11880 [Candidatus Marinimicrobia bacterium]|nr:hypothetical protein [Candidatus Neomarinimicrobiota bacterium]